MSEPAEPQAEKSKRSNESKRKKTGTHPQRRPITPRRRLIGEGATITPEITEKIVQALRIGSHLNTACTYAGVPPATFTEWLRHGRDGWEPYVDLVEKIDMAIAEGEMRDIARLDAAGDKYHQALMFKLERRWPDRWGEKKEIAVGAGRPFIDPSKLTLEEQMQLRALLVKASPEQADLPDGGKPAAEILATSIDGEVVSEEEVA